MLSRLLLEDVIVIEATPVFFPSTRSLCVIDPPQLSERRRMGRSLVHTCRLSSMI